MRRKSVLKKSLQVTYLGGQPLMDLSCNGCHKCHILV